MNKWQYLPHDLWFLKWKALGASSPSADLGRLRTSAEDFNFFRNLRKWPCRLQKSQHSQDENLTLISQKKLACILLPYRDQLIALDVKWNTKWTTYLKRCTSSKTFCSAVRVADVKHSNSTTRKRRLFSGQTPYGVRFPKAHGLVSLPGNPYDTRLRSRNASRCHASHTYLKEKFSKLQDIK